MENEKRLWHVALQGRDMKQPYCKVLCDECLELFPDSMAMTVNSKREVLSDVLDNYWCGACGQSKSEEDAEILRVSKTHEPDCECATCMTAYKMRPDF